MLRLLVVLSATLVASCSPASGMCKTPINDACAQKAQDVAVAAELARQAAKRGATPDDVTSEYIVACEAQLQYDLDQTLVNLEALADAGTPAKDASQ